MQLHPEYVEEKTRSATDWSEHNRLYGTSIGRGYPCSVPLECGNTSQIHQKCLLEYGNMYPNLLWNMHRGKQLVKCTALPCTHGSWSTSLKRLARNPDGTRNVERVRCARGSHVCETPCLCFASFRKYWIFRGGLSTCHDGSICPHERTWCCAIWTFVTFIRLIQATGHCY